MAPVATDIPVLTKPPLSQMKKVFGTVLVALLLPVGQGAVAQTADTLAAAQRYEVLFMDAMLHRQKGDDAAAFDLLQRCIELDSTASEAYYFQAQYYLRLKNQDRALACFEKAADLNPENATYMETLAEMYISREQYAKATEVVASLYDKHKDRDDLLELLYRLYYQQHDLDNAIKTLERMELIDGKTERLSYAKSNLYLENDNRPAALAEIKALADQYPNDLNYRGFYGSMLLMNEQEQEALDVFADVLREEPNNIHALLSLRNFYKGKGDTAVVDSLTRRVLLAPNAGSEQRINLLRQEISENQTMGGDSTQIISMFRMVMAQKPLDVEVAALYAAYMDLKKMPRDSIQSVLEQLLQAAPDNAAARLQLVGYAWDAADMDRVIELCRDARQYNADEMAFYYYQGMAYYRKNDSDHALDAFRNGISVITDESDPTIASDFYAVLGDLLHQKGMMREAFAAYDSCLQKRDDNIGCLNNYAYYLSELGQQLDRAEQMSYKTIKAEPKNPTYLDTYAWILFKEQRYTEARVYIDQAVQNDPERSGVLLEHAGDIYAMAGDVEGAVRLWQQAYEQDNDNKLLAKKIRQRKYIKKK